jgi:hypothetical protein
VNKLSVEDSELRTTTEERPEKLIYPPEFDRCEFSSAVVDEVGLMADALVGVPTTVAADNAETVLINPSKGPYRISGGVKLRKKILTRLLKDAPRCLEVRLPAARRMAIIVETPFVEGEGACVFMG